MKKKFSMYKLLLALMIILSLSLGACSQPTTSSEVTEPEEVSEAEPEEEVLEPEPEEVTEAEPQEKVTLLMESWFGETLGVWDEIIIPAFNAHHPNIEVVFEPTESTKYNAALNAKMEGGTAGDLITLRAFDPSLALFEAGYLAPLDDLPGMEHFNSVARSAWVTDDGSHVYGVPMASVIQGFIYNVEIFDELKLTPPTTEEEFFTLLEAVKTDGKYVPLAIGTSSLWDSATMGFQNIGPNYWKGEEGRLGLINGTEKFTDPQYVAVWETLAKWRPYLDTGYQAMTADDAVNMFALGRAAVFPAGSWNIAYIRSEADFEIGAFPPPPKQGSEECYISNHTDMAVGMNAATKYPEEVKTFLEWVTTEEFADIYANNMIGFFPMSDYDITIKDAAANEFVSWRNTCQTTIRNSYQILSRNQEPNLENELWQVTAAVLNGDLTPEEAATRVQTGLESWYGPQQ